MSTGITRQIVLDTETTGMNQIGAHYEGHKIIEIGAVEVVNRRLTGNNFHVYLKPDRLVDRKRLVYTESQTNSCLINLRLPMWPMSFSTTSAVQSWSSITHRLISALWITNLLSSGGIFRRQTNSAKLPITGAGEENVSRQAQQP